MTSGEATPTRTIVERLDHLLDRGWGWLLLGGLMVIAALPAVMLTRLHGDEYTYTAMARTIAGYFQSDVSLEALAQTLVGDGHFMPGPALLAAPLYLAFAEPAAWLLRAWFGAIMVLLWLWSIVEVRRNLGPHFTLAAIVFPAVTISWHLMAATANGDVAGGLLLLVVVARTCGTCRALIEGERLCIRSLLTLELILASMIYMRGPTILIAVIAHAAILGAALLGRARLADTTIALLCGLALLFTTLLPWMLVTKRVLGEPLITTSSLPLSIAYTFGNREQLCFGRCESGNIWHVMPEFSRTEAARRGVGQLEVQRSMSRYALRELTRAKYFHEVRGNVLRFIALPTEEPTILVSGSYRLPKHLRPLLINIVRTVDLPMYAIFLLTLFVGNVLVVRRDPGQQIVSLAIKLATLVIFISLSFTRATGATGQPSHRSWRYPPD